MAVTEEDIASAGIVRWNDAEPVSAGWVPPATFPLAIIAMHRAGTELDPMRAEWRWHRRPGGYDVYIVKYGELFATICYSTTRGAWL